VASGPHAGAKAVYAIDPDGYVVEIYQRAPQ
jgi:catechol-2,3-dioxygenase